jgi:chromosomal replication initiation ATPase DnaA
VRPPVDQVLKALAKRYRLKVEDLMKDSDGRDNDPRKFGIYLVRELFDLKLKEIAERFGTRSQGAIGRACHGVTSRMHADAKFRDL